MEFPHLGEHCSLVECNQLDFLPFKCIGCSLVFCKDHFEFSKHACVEASQYDHQVPICPICNSPVSFKYGDLPDVKMNQHIEQECSVKQKRNANKIYKNRCSMGSYCKNKEIIELICDGCKLNYCLKHRHPSDHNCSKKYFNDKNNRLTGRQTGASSSAATAAMQRIMNNSLNKTSNFVQKISNMVSLENTPKTTPTNHPQSVRSSNNVANIQGGLREDEALAIALQESLNQQHTNTTSSSITGQGSRNSPIVLSDNEDDDLRRAIELSRQDFEKNKEKCLLS